MRIKITTLFFVFISIFFSCKKDPSMEVGTTGPSGTTNSSKLSEVLVDNQSSSEYVYTDSDLVSEEKSKYDYTINKYDNIGQLISSQYYTNDDILSSDAQVSATALSSPSWVTPASGKEGGIITYEYNANGQLTKSSYSLPTSPCSDHSEFAYDANNMIIRQTMYWDTAPTGYIDYLYDSKGNLINETLYNTPSTGTAELVITTSYEFDNSKNPYKAFNNLKIPGISTNSNNITKETYTIHLTADQGSDKVQIIENTYQYNALGYPTTKNGNTSFVYE